MHRSSRRVPATDRAIQAEPQRSHRPVAERETGCARPLVRSANTARGPAGGAAIPHRRGLAHTGAKSAILSVVAGDRLYGLDALGWLQFEQLCMRLLELECAIPAGAWHEDPAGVRGLSTRRDLSMTDGPTLHGPVRVAPVWVTGVGEPDGLGFDGWWEQVIGRRPDLAFERPVGSLLILTNCDAFGEHGEKFVGRPGGPLEGIAIGVVGQRWISSRIDARPDLRRAMPSLLGLGEHSFADPGVSERSTFALAAARDLARVFVPTSAYMRTLDVLQRHHFVVLTGPPEMGKTAIARTIALTQLTDGWEAVECTDPEQLWSQRDDSRRQAFIADDAFGSTEYRPDAAERWAREMDRILRSLDSRHWLLWTSRPAPLRAALARIHRERGASASRCRARCRSTRARSRWRRRR